MAPASERPQFGSVPEARELLLRPRDVGTLEVHDAVVLPSGRVVLALGELGVELWTPAGRRVRGWDVPARRLVLADSGSFVFAGIARGQTTYWQRVDLVSGARQRWGEGRFAPVAETTDGVGWWVAQGDRLTLLDVQSRTPRSLWSVQLGEIRALERVGSGVVVLARSREEHEVYVYRDGRLTSRKPVALPDGFAPVDLDDDGHVWGIQHGMLLRLPGSSELFSSGGSRRHTEAWSWVHRPPSDKGPVTATCELAFGDRVVLRTQWGQAPRGRFTSGCLVVCDAVGRVLAWRLDHGDLVVDLRR